MIHLMTFTEFYLESDEAFTEENIENAIRTAWELYVKACNNDSAKAHDYLAKWYTLRDYKIWMFEDEDEV